MMGRPFAPKTSEQWEAATKYWRTLKSDDDVASDRTVVLDASSLIPLRHLGHLPEMVITVDDRVPDPTEKGRSQA